MHRTTVLNKKIFCGRIVTENVSQSGSRAALTSEKDVAINLEDLPMPSPPPSPASATLSSNPPSPPPYEKPKKEEDSPKLEEEVEKEEEKEAGEDRSPGFERGSH